MTSADTNRSLFQFLRLTWWLVRDVLLLPFRIVLSIVWNVLDMVFGIGDEAYD